jgi:hypothetical protein
MRKEEQEGRMGHNRDHVDIDRPEILKLGIFSIQKYVIRPVIDCFL